ncbi:glutathione S-transferase N-terminal domain-containing protein [Allorhizobium undicola]|uniref:glutathione S-transferase N-terminal domain-containing protein n=1 Tax=Allorhizobium undicola TaxID=78527 RepID=UPI001FD9D7C7|nr:glutathione S-transferase N-terminal domain-containing protein [Allorhizobium undicola]
MTIILYDLVGSNVAIRFSPHCWKTRMSLAHKGLQYETVPTTFTGVPNVEDGVSRAIPVIRDGDRVIADSFLIALSLDDAYPDRPGLFAGQIDGPFHRALVSAHSSSLYWYRHAHGGS